MMYKGIDFEEIVDVYDVIDVHDREVEILGYDHATGIEYAAVAMESCGEIVEIYEDTIEKVEMKSPSRVLGD